jgi:cysteinyl-tRNA synthetase
VGGDVYFSVDSFPDYGELSGRKLDDNRAGERVSVDERKRNPADFALWKVQPYKISQMLVCNTFCILFLWK